MQLLRGVLLAGVAAGVAGCNLSTDISVSRPVAEFLMVITGNDASGYTINPQMRFVRVMSNTGYATPSSAAPDSCVDQEYKPFPPTGLAVGNIGGGAAITVQTDQATATLKPVAKPNGTLYEVEGNTAVPLTPGAPVTVTIPGDPNGFPSMTATAPTVKPFTLGKIDPQPTGTLRLTWSPPQTGAAAVVISMQYASVEGSSVADREVVCFLRDTGQFDVPSLYLQGWKKSSDAARRVDAYRFLITSKLQDNGLFVADSHVDIAPKTTFP